MVILLPIAGRGQRFIEQGFDVPKPLIDAGGEPLIQVALDSLQLQGHYVFVLGPLTPFYKKRLHSILKEFSSSCTIIDLQHTTRGPAETCLAAAKEIIGSPVISANCDQVMHWDGPAFQRECMQTPCDALVVTYPATTNKNSYVKVDENKIALEFKEKQVISPYSLNGIHFWKDGQLLVDSAQEMINKNDTTAGEFYIAPSFNYLVHQNKKVGIYEILPSMHHAVGTPQDLALYLQNHSTRKKVSNEGF